MPDDERRPLLDHLEELRRRLWICLVAVAAGAAATYAVREPILAWLLAPVAPVAFTSISEPFVATLKLAAWGGVVLGSPVILWQVWEFSAVALRPEARRLIGRLIPLSVGFFLAGAWASVAWLAPLTIRFFLRFATDQMIPMISVSRYLGFVGSLMLAGGLVTQTPLVIAVLARVGIVTPVFLVHQWRAAVVGSFLVAAVATPTPDIVTQTVLAVILIMLYGISIGLAAIMQPSSRASRSHLDVAEASQ